MKSARNEPNYSLIANAELSDEFDREPKEKSFQIHKHRIRIKYLFWVLLAVLCLSLSFAGGAFFWSLFNSQKPRFGTCPYPSTRREWRSLSRSEKLQYIEAVQCLRETPSRLNINQSLYDDFPYVHENVGDYSHGAAPFLAWHRYFLHTYETALRNDCHYQGHLTYWDWTLDWEDITKAPVWDNEIGFGGNGDISDGQEVLEGYCVTDGPFKRLQIPYVGKDYEPHCLSRGFESSENLTRLGQDIRPAAIEKLFSYGEYEPFNINLEITAHNSIPHSVRGDFLLFTAPFDPVFFLHHTQLDRIWWEWQQVDPQNRYRMYEGRAAHKSPHNADLGDVIPMGGIAPDIKVLEILQTESSLLCYRY